MLELWRMWGIMAGCSFQIELGQVELGWGLPGEPVFILVRWLSFSFPVTFTESNRTRNTGSLKPSVFACQAVAEFFFECCFKRMKMSSGPDFGILVAARANLVPGRRKLLPTS